MRAKLLGAVAVMTLAATGAHASLIADGITYDLSYTIVNTTTETFTLSISGINGSSDTEKGRYGVQSFALGDPSGNTPPTATTPPSGFVYNSGGLNANGCNGNGSFYCFSATTTPTGPALAANSSLSFSFTVSTAPSAFPANYNPDFKINWVGTKNNYDLVSKSLTPTLVVSVPEPSSLLLLVGGITMIGFIGADRYARRR